MVVGAPLDPTPRLDVGVLREVLESVLSAVRLRAERDLPDSPLALEFSHHGVLVSRARPIPLGGVSRVPRERTPRPPRVASLDEHVIARHRARDRLHLQPPPAERP